MVQAVIYSVLTFVVWIALLTAALRLTEQGKHYRLVWRIYALSVGMYLLIFFLAPDARSFLRHTPRDVSFFVGVLYGLVLNFLLFCSTMEIYYSIDRPVTLRLLVEIFRSHPRPLSFRAIENRYHVRYMVERRLAILTETGYVFQKEGKHFLTPKGKRLATICRTGSRLFGIVSRS